jgi:hypothetical protein
MAHLQGMVAVEFVTPVVVGLVQALVSIALVSTEDANDDVSGGIGEGYGRDDDNQEGAAHRVDFAKNESCVVE